MWILLSDVYFRLVKRAWLVDYLMSPIYPIEDIGPTPPKWDEPSTYVLA